MSDDKVSLRRRFAAIVYDTIGATALVYFAAFVPVLIVGDVVAPGNPLFGLYIILVVWAYFCVCWTTSGQTIGMQAWKIRVTAEHGERRLTWLQASYRLLTAWCGAALLGLGFWFALIDKEKRTWHDKASKSLLIRVHP
ncbi:MAG: RDD family protein [Pseudomonadota bacterium]